MSYEIKNALQQFIFPKGINFENNKFRFLTIQVNFLLYITKRKLGI